LIERSLEEGPHPLDPHIMLVQACLVAVDLEAARGAAQRGLALHPRSPALHFLLGQVEGQRGCTVESRAAHETALALDPTLHASWAQLAVADFSDGDDAHAIVRYRRALELDPMNHRSRLFYGAALERTGELEAARDNVEFACAGLYPADARMWSTYGMMFLQVRATESAFLVTETGAAAYPDDPELEELLSQARAETDR
jgi:Flp pilus assembly protein TadD